MARKHLYGTSALCAPIAALALVAAPVWAGEITELSGVAGDGFILIDTDENVVEPGIKAVTVNINNDDRTSANGFSPSSGPGVTELDYNCLMASNDNTCDAEPGTGKRYKTQLTGRNPFDIGFNVAGTEGVTEYFHFGKTTNQTGARILGFSMQLGTGTGDEFAVMDTALAPDMAVFFDQLVPLSERALEWPGLDGATEGQNPLQRVFYPDGLFGEGGQEGDIGFFNEVNGGFVAVPSADLTTIDATTLFNDEHIALFGDGLLPRTAIPTGLFWDDNDNPADESALIAWLNPSQGGYLYGNIAVDDPGTAENELDLRIEALAAAAGLDVADLAYAPGAPVPEAVLASFDSAPIFVEGPIEDLSNLNLNFSFDVGDIAGGNFTLRIAPRFAELVTETETASQFRTAAALDLANVPYIASEEERAPYLALIDQLLAAGNVEGGDIAAQNRALDSMGFSFLETFTGLSFGIVQEQVYVLSTPADFGRPGGATISTQGDAWRSIGDGLNALVSISGGSGEVDPNGGNAGYDFTTYSATVGLSFQVSGPVSAGVIVGYGDSDADIDGNLGSVNVDGASVAGFVQGSFANGASVRGFLGYQDLSFDSQRNIFIPGNPVQTARGDTSGSMFFAGVTGDLPLYRATSYEVGLMGAIEYYDTEVDGFTETGAGILNLTVGDQNTDLTVARLGMRGQAQFGNTRPYGHIAYATRNGDDLDVLTSLGGVLPGVTPVAAADDDWLDLGLGMVVDLGGTAGNTRLRAEYRGAVADDYNRHSARIAFEMAF